MRTTMCIGLLETLSGNVNRGERSTRIFETGKVYLCDTEDLLHCERDALGLAWLGRTGPHWSEQDRDFDFFDAKGVVESLLIHLGIRDFQFERFDCDYFHPGQSGRWSLGDLNLAVVGKLHPRVTESFDLPEDPILVEMDIDTIAASLSEQRLTVNAPSPYPPIRRDLSLTVPLETAARDVLSLIEESRTPYLESVILFDRYFGEQLEEGRQSLGFRLTYRSEERTLTEEEISPIHMKLLRELNEKLGAIQRGMNLETTCRE